MFNIIYLFTAIGLLPGGSGYFTCKQNTKLVTTKFKSGRLHEKHVVATWNLWSALHSSRFNPTKNPVPIAKETRCASGQVWKARKISPTGGFAPRTLYPVASRCTDCTSSVIRYCMYGRGAPREEGGGAGRAATHTFQIEI